jgi:hypothetical protein
VPAVDASSRLGMRLEINGDLQRSEVLRSQDDVLTAGEAWKVAMIDKGWE